MKFSSSDVLNNDFIKKYIYSNALFNIDRCIHDYIVLTGSSYEEAHDAIINYFNINYTVWNKKTNRLIDENHYVLYLFIKVGICYLIGFKFSPNNNFFSPLIVAIASYLAITIITAFIHLLNQRYTKIDDMLIEDHIENNMLDIQQCLDDYMKYNPKEDVQKVNTKIVDYFCNHYEIVKRPDIRKAPNKNNTQNIHLEAQQLQKHNNHKLLKSNITKKFCCPYCGSTDISLIDDAPGGYESISYGPMVTHHTDKNIGLGYGVFKIEKRKKKKKVFSKRKALAGLLTGGSSLLVTGIKSKVTSEWICNNCHKHFYRK